MSTWVSLDRRVPTATVRRQSLWLPVSFPFVSVSACWCVISPSLCVCLLTSVCFLLSPSLSIPRSFIPSFSLSLFLSSLPWALSGELRHLITCLSAQTLQLLLLFDTDAQFVTYALQPVDTALPIQLGALTLQWRLTNAARPELALVRCARSRHEGLLVLESAALQADSHTHSGKAIVAPLHQRPLTALGAAACAPTGTAAARALPALAPDGSLLAVVHGSGDAAHWWLTFALASVKGHLHHTHLCCPSAVPARPAAVVWAADGRSVAVVRCEWGNWAGR